MQCKARLITSGNRIVSGRQPEHTHSGNVATAMARKAVGEKKTKMNDMNATSSSSQASVAATLDNDVLMALPKRKTVARTLQRTRLKATTAAAGGTPLPAVPSDLQFAIPSRLQARCGLSAPPHNFTTPCFSEPLGCPGVEINW